MTLIISLCCHVEELSFKDQISMEKQALCFERQKGQQCAYFFGFQRSNHLQNHRSPLTGTVHLAVSMEE